MPNATETIARQLLEIPAHDFIRLLKVVPREELARAAASHFTTQEARTWTPRIQVLKQRTYLHLGVTSTRQVRAIALERGWIKETDSFVFKDTWIKVEKLARKSKPRPELPPVPQDVALEDLSSRELRVIAQQERVPNWSRTTKLGGGGLPELVRLIKQHREESQQE